MSSFPRRPLLAWSKAFTCCVLGSILILTSCGKSKPKLPPEAQALLDKCKQIREEMSEAEVDAIFDCPSYKYEDKRDRDASGWKEFSRPSTTTKVFSQGDYYALVYLDESGYVLGVTFGEYVK